LECHNNEIFRLNLTWDSLPSTLLPSVASISTTIEVPQLSKEVQGIVSTFAGNGTRGHAEGGRNEAMFSNPSGITLDSLGNCYVTDSDNHKIRRITKYGIVTTIAGSGAKGNTDGVDNQASFNAPVGIVMDQEGNLFVADQENHKIRKITKEGTVSTIAGNGSEGFTNAIGTHAKFSYPWGIALDVQKNIFVADCANHRIRKSTPDGFVSTIAGNGSEGCVDGTGSQAKFNYPKGIALDSEGNIFVADSFNHRIRKVTVQGDVITLAGSSKGYEDGVGTLAMFNHPSGIALGESGNLLVIDEFNHIIRKVTQKGEVSTVAGSCSNGYKDEIGSIAQFSYPRGVAVDCDGVLFVVDQCNNRIRKVM